MRPWTASLDFHPSVHKHKRTGMIIYLKKYDQRSRGLEGELSQKPYKTTRDVSLLLFVQASICLASCSDFAL